MNHPLFPARDDVSDAPEVLTIHVVRAGEGYATRSFAPDELTSLDQLYELYGGGHYTLIARDDRKITSRQTYTIPGPARPLNDGAAVHAAAAPPSAPAAAAPASPLGGGSDFLVAVLQMMQNSQENTNKLFAMMMQQGQDSQRRHIESMQALHDRSAATQGDLTRAILEVRAAPAGGDNSSAEWFMRGQQHGEKMATKLSNIADRLEPDDEEGHGLVDELGELLGPIMAGMGQHQQQQQAAAAPAPEPPPPAPAPATAPAPDPGGNGAREPVPFRPQGRPIHEPTEQELDA